MTIYSTPVFISTVSAKAPTDDAPLCREQTSCVLNKNERTLNNTHFQISRVYSASGIYLIKGFL